MDDWGRALYGDPCRGCGFSWSIPLVDAIDWVSKAPLSYATALAGATGRERHPELEWSVGAYVCHVVDNLRIWAERLVGASHTARAEVAGYDERLLALARNYEGVALEGALWSLERAVGDWQWAVGAAPDGGVVMVHQERSGLTIEDVIRATAHDAFHHRWDIVRSLEAGTAR